MQVPTVTPQEHEKVYCEVNGGDIPVIDIFVPLILIESKKTFGEVSNTFPQVVEPLHEYNNGCFCTTRFKTGVELETTIGAVPFATLIPSIPANVPLPWSSTKKLFNRPEEFCTLKSYVPPLPRTVNCPPG